MKIAEAEAQLRRRLETIYPPSESAAMAALVLESVTGLERSALLLARQTPLEETQEKRLGDISARLLNEEPVQYVLGASWFAGMQLYVDPSVLIPRPETEELVDWIVQDVKSSGLDVFRRNTTDADQTTLLKILDVGTGSGCIALALKKQMPLAEVWGCDLSEKALNVARRNGSSLNIRVDFQGIDFLDEAQQPLLPSVDILVSNPPYIPERDKDTMNGNVLRYEPHLALFVPDQDALLFYRAIACFGHRRLHDSGTIYLEIHENLGAEVKELFLQEGYKHVEIRMDMQGKERMVRVRK